MDTAKFESAGKSRLQDAGDRAQDYLDRASQTASSGMDRWRILHVAVSTRRPTSAKAGLDWAADQADSLRDQNAALVNAMTDTVTARPLMAIGVAAAVGYLLGRIMRSGD